ncbi:hypothetical protein HD554DRAFT_2040044 [Boletus coccyginus]|nr:hypothetical protein HD554DRAFT_2040044 [Boletus coccyginus]
MTQKDEEYWLPYGVPSESSPAGSSGEGSDPLLVHHRHSKFTRGGSSMLQRQRVNVPHPISESCIDFGSTLGVGKECSYVFRHASTRMRPAANMKTKPTKSAIHIYSHAATGRTRSSLILPTRRVAASYNERRSHHPFREEQRPGKSARVGIPIQTKQKQRPARQRVPPLRQRIERSFHINSPHRSSPTSKSTPQCAYGSTGPISAYCDAANETESLVPHITIISASSRRSHYVIVDFLRLAMSEETLNQSLYVHFRHPGAHLHRTRRLPKVVLTTPTWISGKTKNAHSEAHRGASVQPKEINVVGRKSGSPYSRGFDAKAAVERGWPKMKHGSNVAYPVSEMMLLEMHIEPWPWHPPYPRSGLPTCLNSPLMI